jgi:hypothetical protein
MSDSKTIPIENYDSSPTIPLTDEQCVRLGDLATQLDQARAQGYAEANLAAQLLALAQELVPLFLPKG